MHIVFLWFVMQQELLVHYVQGMCNMFTHSPLIQNVGYLVLGLRQLNT